MNTIISQGFHQKESLDMKSAGNSVNDGYYYDNRMATADGAILLARKWYPRPTAEKRDQKGPTF